MPAYRIFNHPGRFINGFHIAGVWIPLKYFGILFLAATYIVMISCKNIFPEINDYARFLGIGFAFTLQIPRLWSITVAAMSLIIDIIPQGIYLSWALALTTIFITLQILIRFSTDQFIHPDILRKEYKRLIKNPISPSRKDNYDS